MKCYCDSLDEINDFRGYGHYQSTLRIMNNNVENDFFIIQFEQIYETFFQCTNCDQIWVLGRPDFPITGFLKRMEKSNLNNEDYLNIEAIYAKAFNQDQWNSIYNYYTEDYSRLDKNFISQFDDLDIPYDIKQVLLCKLGEELRRWINSSIPAFGGKRPANYLLNEEGIKILKAGIMRMPD